MYVLTIARYKLTFGFYLNIYLKYKAIHNFLKLKLYSVFYYSKALCACFYNLKQIN